MSPQKLELYNAPLSGVSLIEASAGTGKTYTITGLYLRLVLGHDCKALSPENILVVTFTKAATEELRGRIRRRLRQAVMAIEADDPKQDPLVFSLLESLDFESALQRLKDAIQIMDLAAIYTIHGFAQKVLSQYAVESHVDDDFELILEQQEIERTAVNDVWRKLVYPMSEAELSVVLGQWRSPEKLLEEIRALIRREALFEEPPLVSNIDEAFEQYQTALNSFSQHWNREGETFLQAIKEHPQANGQFTRHLDTRKQKINDFIAGVPDKDIDKVLGYFDEAGISKSVKKNQVPIEHSLIAAFTKIGEDLQQWQQQKQYALLRWKIRFVETIRERIHELKRKQSLLSADDLLKQVLHALKSNNALVNLLRQQFPVAMVDEFQDTDSIQYQVFAKLYMAERESERDDVNQDMAFFMIGDPKQAIYKFRGADIFTYIQAKNEVQREFSLKANYRSAPPLVAAVNCLFAQHSSPFLYDDSIPFYPVDSAASAKLIRSSSTAESGCVLQTLKIGKNAAVPEIRMQVAQGVAEQISTILRSGLSKDTQVYDKDMGAYRAVKSQDVAVLVRSAKQARLVKQALDERGIACVFRGQESLFESEEARAIYDLLLSMHSMNEQAYRNALANPIWMLSLQDLWGHLQQDNAWEKELDLLYECQGIWKRHGIMPMLTHWLHSRKLAQKWFAFSDGERRVTNYLHMAELLQEQAAKLQGMQGILTWFEHKLQNKGNSDEATLRLESDANLVSIVTVHSSKGLEYPIVFLPFTWSMSNKTDLIYFDEDQQVLCCDLQDKHQDLREKEQLAEEVRLFYVGVTRASSQLYVTVPISCDTKKISDQITASPLFHVLCGSNEHKAESEPAAQISKCIDDLINVGDGNVFTKQALSLDQTQFIAPENQGDLSVAHFHGEIKQPWFMSSFSSLVKGLHAPHHQRFNFDEDVVVDDKQSENSSSEIEPEQLNPFSFPKGAHAGNFLHHVFEDIDFYRPVVEQKSVVHDLLIRYGFDEKWLDTLISWSTAVLQTPLLDRDSNSEIKLANLTDDLKSVEMEFYFPVAGLSSKRFNTLLQKYPVLQDVKDLPLLKFDYLKGMLKGFIDLTFQWNGRYYVLDYKSNYLGDSMDAYHQLAMEQAMADHRYDVQLIIYTLALHRLLKLSLPNYDYDEHIGGGFYLFLRGFEVGSENGQFYHKPKRELIEALDAVIAGSDSNGV